MWAGTISLGIDGWHVGIRIGDETTLEVLRETLADLIVEQEAKPNWSLRLDTEADAPVHLLYRTICLIDRSRSAPTLVTSLLRELAAIAPRTPGHRFDGVALTSDAGAVLVPELFRRRRGTIGPPLAAAGWAMDSTTCTVDVGEGAANVHVTGAIRDLSDEATAALAAGDARPGIDPRPTPGALALRGLLIRGGSGARPAAVVGTLIDSLEVHDQADAQTLLDGLATVAPGLHVVDGHPTQVRELVRALEDVGA